jgi:hypothetical protein
LLNAAPNPQSAMPEGPTHFANRISGIVPTGSAA